MVERACREQIQWEALATIAAGGSFIHGFVEISAEE
jgi:hypothetical protein